MEKEKINKKKLITYLTILVAVLILGTVTATYAFFQATTDSETIAKTTIVGKTDCIKIEFSTDSNRMGFDLDYPITDEYAMQRIQPVIVSIHNTCAAGQEPINYTLTLSTFAKSSGSYMKDSQIRTNIKKTEPYASDTDYRSLIETQYLDELLRVSSDEGYNNKLLTDHFKELKTTNPDEFSDFDYNSYDTITNYVIDTSSVTSLSTNKYKIYLWVDYYEGDKNAYNPGATHDEEYDNKTMNHDFESLVSLIVNNKEEGVEPPMLAAEKLKKNLTDSAPGLIETPDKGDLAYRYVGKQAQSSSIKNYVCFGASSCTGGTDNHLYRIIGITAEGNLKIQKNNSIGTPQWYTSFKSDTKWLNSTIYAYLKGSNFYTNNTYVSQSMKAKIDENHTWNTGDVGDEQYSDGTTVYNAEKTTNSHIGAVGLAYLSDYYFAYNENGTANCHNDPYCESWMVPSSYSGLWGNQSYEWTMTRYGQYSNGNYCAWSVDYSGKNGAYSLNAMRAVRPVFYLKSEVTISGGEGTSSSPYIIN